MFRCSAVPLIIKYKAIHIRKKSYYQHKYNVKLEEQVNKQIQAEQEAAQDYLSMAVIFLHPSVSRPGAGGFFMRMYTEELGHMQDFINYQLLRGGTPLINGLKTPTQRKELKLIDAFNVALCMEKNIAELLEEVASMAEALKDYQCADFITTSFLSEQMQAVNEISNHITKLERLRDNEHAIYHYDLQLAKDYPYSYKSPKDLK